MSDKKYFKEPFKYREYYVEDYVNKIQTFTPVNMLGMVNQLKEIKKWLENNFTNINYMTYDIEYHGWRGDTAKNMHNINDELTILALQMYLVCCQALNESPYEEEKYNV